MMMWDYWRLFFVLLVSSLIGWLFEQTMTFLFIGTLLYTLWLQESWNQLLKWIRKSKKNPAPSAEGVIDEICREIDRMRQQSSSRKKKMANYLKRFQSATAALPDAIVVMAPLGEVEWANRSAKRLLGVCWPRDNGLRVSHLIRDPSFQGFIVDEEAIGKTVISVSPVNSAIRLEFKVVKYMGNGRMLIGRDITQTVKLQKMRRDFVANVSHELRTPLTVLRGYLEMFDANTTHEQWSNVIPTMRKQSERMGNLLSELLVLSRLEMGEKAMHVVPVDVSHVLQELIVEAKRLKEYQEHNISIETASDYWILADVGEFRSALSNLVYNAVKYTPKGSAIRLCWSLQQEQAVIAIKDNGEGIADHHLPRLTERFYRVNDGSSNRVDGTGLGLAIVKHILQRHDAKLEITSVLGKGSCFSCCFPLDSAVGRPPQLGVVAS